MPFDPNEPRDYHGRWVEDATSAIQKAASDKPTGTAAVFALYKKKFEGKDLPIKEGLDFLEEAKNGEGYFAGNLRNATENLMFIPTKQLENFNETGFEYDILPKPNENTVIEATFRYPELTENRYITPMMYDKTLVDRSGNIINNKYHDMREGELNTGGYDPNYLYRGMSEKEYSAALKNGYFKSNASMNIGDVQAGTTSFAQDIRQASSYAQGFTAWYDSATFNDKKYVVKIKKEGVNFQPTIASDPRNEVDVFGKIPVSNLADVYEIRLASSTPGNIAVYKQNGSNKPREGSRFPMYQKTVWRKL